MVSRKITIINKLGLHARAAAKLVQTASSFDSDVSVRHKDKEVSGKSIMGIMMLAASRGNTIEIIVAGPDEKKALDAVVKLIENKFDEKE